MELRLPLEMSPGSEAACRAVFGTWGFFSERCTEKLPLRVDFIHRLEFGEVSGHRVLIKRGPGNRCPTECGATHEATSGTSATPEDIAKADMMAYELSCLGITVFRDGCKDTQVLHLGTGAQPALSDADGTAQ